jgi:cytochrome c biogenesis protein CcmG/thiol:disulfide interchange protein DsbE
MTPVKRTNVAREVGSGERAVGKRFALLSVCALTLAACGGGGQPAASPSEGGASVVGQAAPDVEFSALQSAGTIKLSSLRGKVVLLDFWASWCAPCQEELPLLDDMATRLKDKNVEIVGLSLDENKTDAEHFLTRKSSWSLTLGHDPEQKVADQFKPPKMPTSYVIDRKGVVRQMNAGFERADAKKIEAQLLDLASAD